MSEAEAAAPLPIVDAHQHFWNLQENYHPWLCDPDLIPFRYGDYSAIRRNYLPADYRRDSRDFRIVKTVHIEAEHDPQDPLGETRWLEVLAEREGLPSACVAQAWLDRPDVEEVLAAQAARSLVCGIRHKPRSAASPDAARRGEAGSMDCPTWRAGYALLAQHGLSFDLQTPWWHLDAAADLARDFPVTQIIINHTALPADRSEAGLAAWRRALENVADLPNVAMKISGLGQAGLPWTVEANRPIIRDAIGILGVTRCLFASNFPVDSLVGSFSEIFAGFLAAVDDLSPVAKHALFHENAVRIYRL
ncbi:amidohydrolase family protein [Aquibaculum arenosum]|uniref:Amidohydrolase family protein n=1 Tax=Aquibaculum arenosum TaxID=3032591 RepID=A0ABT5YNB1_9PROT|nr:amidohydrolase family protein [Fodinicurvata sp. CAU 1616]MDF2096467.1 amidohydrolase family protein [Fodinicurvata sp. CAU 1616]